MMRYDASRSSSNISYSCMELPPIKNVENYLPRDEGIHLGPEHEFRNGHSLVHHYNGNERQGRRFLEVDYGGWNLVSLGFLISLDPAAASKAIYLE